MINENITNKEEKSGVLLVSGFLGAGKTTFLKHLLSWKQDMSDTVVIVNEFGDIGIDGSLIQGEDSDVIELTSGCICCTLVVDMTVMLMELWERFNPRHIIIEASGVADPVSLISLFERDEIRQHVRFVKVITVLDADWWQLRKVMGQIFHHQLETADMILLNKIDRLENEKVKRIMKEIREALPDTRVVPTVHCRVDWDTIWADIHHDPENRMGTPSTIQILSDKEMSEGAPLHGRQETPHGHEHGIHAEEAGFFAFSFRESLPLHEASFKQVIDNLPPEIFRVKGPVRFQNGTLLINYVGGRADWTPWDGEPETRLAFIGWDTTGDAVLAGLKKCVVS